MFEIRTTATKGLGIFASSPISRGTRILSERPLLALRHDEPPSAIFLSARLLPPTSLAHLLNLSHFSTPEASLIRWGLALHHTVAQTLLALLNPRRRLAFPFPCFNINRNVTILSIFRSNAFNLGVSSVFKQALFPHISRLNHSCVPNAQGSFEEERGRFNVHATRDIGVDEEVTLNYLQERGEKRDSRRGRLESRYGFVCACPACDLGVEKGKRGEEGRAELQNRLGIYAQDVVGDGLESPKRELEMVEQFIGLLEGDRIAGRELSTLYFEAARLNGILRQRGEALRCAERGLQIDADCLGKDHAQYQKSLEQVEIWR